MAELVLKIRDHPDVTGYKDGDIVCAFNQRRIRCVHAEHICHIKNTSFNGDGLNVEGVARKFQEFIYQYKIERVSKTEIKRIELSSMKEEILSNIPDAKGQAIDVPYFIFRRLNKFDLITETIIPNLRHRIFGTKGNEFWYGGRVDVSNIVLDNVWNMIEIDTPNLESNFTLWPLTDTEKKEFLGLKINDFGETEAQQFVESEYKIVGEEEVLQKKRRRNIDWQSMSLPVTKKDIEDATKSIDIREQVTLNKDVDIKTKSLSL